ncbi:LytR/AlgR family response regulator transcription factor [Bacillus subtilis]|uniref:LytR/AlgR family response regulator transcription factor n=1 Tax=Bacillus subtilis TaxID=1423 RepID=UPI00089E030E|nr:LytTR family DNA-binding domain-containing protein [Bacillus subtilis]AOY05438.1 hypothetical protein BKN48_08830 [Bacillus subtilis]
MVKLKVVILDEEMSDLYRVVNLVNSISELELVIATTKAEDMLEVFNVNKIDIAIMDLNISNSHGFEAAEYLISNYPRVKIIFMSYHVELGIKAYKYYPEDYLIKPINVFRLNQTIKRIVSYVFGFPRIDKIVIKSKSMLKFIDIPDINYIERKENSTRIYLENGEVISSKESLNDLELRLRVFGFYRIHQSYIVPIKKIQEVKPDNYMKSYNLKLKGTKEILSLSRNKYKMLRALLM